MLYQQNIYSLTSKAKYSPELSAQHPYGKLVELKAQTINWALAPF